MSKKTIRDIDVKGKKCLVRVDFNVPIKNGVITDENRINGALPTIKYLMENGARVVLCSHLGRPKGTFNMEYTLKPIADRLNQLLGGKVKFATDVIGESAKATVASLNNGDVALLENLRFHKEEEKNEEGFCKELAQFCDIYVNDAFGTAHRAHASTAGVVQYKFVNDAVCGFLIDKELSIMAEGLNNPIRPFVAILGGAKVSDKIEVINNLIDKCDTIIIGGGMAYTFFKAQGKSIGNSICENDKLELATELINKAKAKGVNLLLPIDNVIADAFSNDANVQTIVGEIPDGWQGLDIGPKTCDLFRKEIIKAKTVIWNGPMGVFEMEKFANGTRFIAESLTMATGATTIVGGGDSVAAITQLGFSDKVSHVSTGGGASLELLEGKDLPGISCLNEK